jgi:hypothetical protein
MNPEAYLIGIGLRPPVADRRMTQWQHTVQWYFIAMIWATAFVFHGVLAFQPL